MAATLAAILNETPPDVSTFFTEVPASLDGLFRAALSRDPAARPPNIDDWADSVAQTLETMSSSDGCWPLPITQEIALRTSPTEPR